MESESAKQWVGRNWFQELNGSGVISPMGCRLGPWSTGWLVWGVHLHLQGVLGEGEGTMVRWHSRLITLAPVTFTTATTEAPLQVFTGPTRRWFHPERCNIVLPCFHSGFHPLVRCHSIVNSIGPHSKPHWPLSDVCLARSGTSELNVGPCHHSIFPQWSNKSKSARFSNPWILWTYKTLQPSNYRTFSLIL